MMRWLALALAITIAVPPVHAQGDKKAAAKKKKADKDKDKDKDDSDSDDSSDDSDSSDDDDKKPKKAKAKAADKADKDDKADNDDKADKAEKADKADKDDEGGGGDEGGGDDEEGGGPSGKGRDKANTGSKDTEPVKQDLNGHDLGTKKKANEFERDRFFVDKADTEATENATLIQGSLTSSSFLYSESGGNYATPPTGFPNAFTQTGLYRLFTDLRLQTDFRHIKGSRWEARVDGRIRFVNSGTSETEATTTPAPAPQLQSGLTGQNEYEIRELWLIRNGERTDVTFGRQFIADLAAVKIDGVRIDYASSQRLTFLGFGGLYPLRGSRSITTDYPDLKDPSTGKALSKYVGTGGFGAAYRTPTAYGSFGGVALIPTAEEQPRVFATANGYWRPNPKVDIYHFALIDLVASYGAQITNLSGGVNYKPTQRLRMTASYNRVDTDTLNIQAFAFLDQPQANPVVQNEIALQRLATNQARGSISAGLGNLQRFEITTAMAYRTRPGITLTPPTMGATGIELPAAKSVEVYGSIVDRRSIKDARIGVDAVQTFGVGNVAFQRDEVFALRGFVGRELDSGKGEWEAEISYAENKDTNVGSGCANVNDLVTCYGSTSGTVLSGGGTLYYRFNRDWFMIAQAYLSRTTLTRLMMAADPTITGLTGYGRIAYRF